MTTENIFKVPYTDKFGNVLNIGDWVTYARTKLGNRNYEIAIGRIKAYQNHNIVLDSYAKSDYGAACSGAGDRQINNVIEEMKVKPWTTSISPRKCCKLAFLPA
jgi:S-adenosylmethionine hydrolase